MKDSIPAILLLCLSIGVPTRAEAETLSWRASGESVQSYILQISDDPAFVPVLAEVTTSQTRYEANLPAGTYYARVAALGEAQGQFAALRGRWSSTRVFVIDPGAAGTGYRRDGGDFDESEEMYKSHQYYLAICDYFLGERDSALERFQRVLTMDPDYYPRTAGNRYLITLGGMDILITMPRDYALHSQIRRIINQHESIFLQHLNRAEMTSATRSLVRLYHMDPFNRYVLLHAREFMGVNLTRPQPNSEMEVFEVDRN